MSKGGRLHVHIRELHRRGTVRKSVANTHGQTGQDIGVSDVAVAKACRKAGIPLPGRGHWAKSEKQRQRKPKPPQVDGKVRFQVLDPDNSLATTGPDLNLPIVRRKIEALYQLPDDLEKSWQSVRRVRLAIAMSSIEPQSTALIEAAKEAFSAAHEVQLMTSSAMMGILGIVVFIMLSSYKGGNSQKAGL